MKTPLEKRRSRGHYKAIGFDLDGTICDFRKTMRHSLEIVLAEILNKIPACGDFLTVDKLIEIRDEVAEELKEKAMSFEEIRLHAFRRTLRYLGIVDDRFAATLTELYLQHRFEDAVLFNEVNSTLEQLKARYVLGVISNGNSYPRRLGLEQYFQFIVLSQDVGVEKPDPLIFLIALQKAGCASCDFLYVGDSQEEDIVGANRAGISVAWLNRCGQERHRNIPRPDYEIHDLSDLLRILIQT